MAANDNFLTKYTTSAVADPDAAIVVEPEHLDKWQIDIANKLIDKRLKELGLI